MPLDPKISAIMEVLGTDHGAQLAAMDVTEAVALIRSGPKPAPANLTYWEDRLLFIDGREVPVRITRPEGDGPFPILMNFHGGGWVTGSVAADDLRCQRLTKLTGCITISVDYRLAPENPFSAGFEDCLGVTLWAFSNALEIDGDPARIAVSGASAGANLAAAVAAQMSEIAFQLLYYPVIDATARGGDPAGGPYYLTRAAMDWYWARYLGDFADRTDPRVSPNLLPDLALMPPALVIAAQYDPLAPEARAYCEALSAAGVPATYVEMPGTIHGFVSFAPDLPQTLEAIEQGATALRQAFKTSPAL